LFNKLNEVSEHYQILLSENISLKGKIICFEKLSENN